MPAIALSVLILIAFISCNKHHNAELQELASLVHQLKTDENHRLFDELMPLEEDLKQIFTNGESISKAISYSNMRWADMSKISINSIKPLMENAELNILSLTKNELRKGETNGLPEEYILIPDHLKDGTT